MPVVHFLSLSSAKLIWWGALQQQLKLASVKLVMQWPTPLLCLLHEMIRIVLRAQFIHQLKTNATGGAEATR